VGESGEQKMLFSNYVIQGDENRHIRTPHMPTSTSKQELNMKKLYIIRHAKAENPTFEGTDFERDLLPEGVEKAIQKATLLAQDLDLSTKGLTHIISSPANRAKQTAQIFCSVLQIPLDQIHYEIKIYEAHYLELLKVLNDCSSEDAQVLIFGHNPGLSDLIAYLTDDYVGLATADIAYLTLDENIDFSILSANTAYLHKVI